MVTRHWFTRSWGIHSLGALQDGYLARCVRLHLLRSIVDMFIALALYPMPSDPQAFRDHYESIHLPLVAKLPGVRCLRYSFDLIAPLGEAPFFAVLRWNGMTPRPCVHRSPPRKVRQLPKTWRRT